MPTTKEFDGRLLEEIRKPGRELLYNLSHKDYKNLRLKKIIWDEIAEAMGWSIEQCKKRWKILRARYVNSRKPRKSGSSGPSFWKNDWLERSLYFLKDVIETKSTNNDCRSETQLSSPSDLSTSQIVILNDGSKVIINQAPETVVKQTNLFEETLKEAENSDSSGSLNGPKWCLDERLNITTDEPITNLKHKIKSPISQQNLSQMSIRKQSSINIIPEKPLIKQPSIKEIAEDSFQHFGKYVAAELRDLPARVAILLQQEIQNLITRTKLAHLEPDYEMQPEIVHFDINAVSENSDDENFDMLT